VSQNELGSKEKISILAMEYGSLRSDINARMSSMFQLSAIFVAIDALVLKPPSDTHMAKIAAAALFLALVGLGLLWHDMVKAGRRVQCLEAEINRRANEKLLIWETELGGLSRGYWR